MTRNSPAGATSKSAKVRELLGSNMSPAAIARKVGCTVGLVYNIKSTSGQAKKRRTGRPGKSAGTPGFAGILDIVKNAERERTRLHSTLQRIQAIVASELG